RSRLPRALDGSRAPAARQADVAQLHDRRVPGPRGPRRGHAVDPRRAPARAGRDPGAVGALPARLDGGKSMNGAGRRRGNWSVTELDRLRQLLPRRGVADTALLLRRSPESVARKAL